MRIKDWQIFWFLVPYTVLVTPPPQYNKQASSVPFSALPPLRFKVAAIVCQAKTSSGLYVPQGPGKHVGVQIGNFPSQVCFEIIQSGR